MKKIGLILLLTIYVVVVFAQKGYRSVFEDVEFNVNPAEFINTAGSDISPTFIENDLYFSGIRERYFDKSSRVKGNMAFYNIYSSRVDDDGNILSSRKMVQGFGLKRHEGPGAYCKTTGELFITVSNTYPALKRMFYFKDISLKIVIAKKTNDKWEVVSELPFNNDNFDFAHPAISQTGDTLVFSSNKESDNFGGSDLFMSIRKNGEWSSPVNLGDSINTTGNEMYPTFIDNMFLSFASDGQANGYGKLDIWYTTFPEKGKIINMGNKVNSHLDDFGLIIHPNRNIGYFSSEISVMGSDDIYTLNIIKLYRTFNGKVADDETNSPIPYAKVDLLDCNARILRSVLTDNLGNFSFEILKNQCPLIEVNKDGYNYSRKSLLGLSYSEIRLKKDL